MRRRSKHIDESGSLDLLLDTITNAFGGIVFLAILIVVLLQNSSQSPSEQTMDPLPDTTALAAQLEELQATNAPLEIQWKAAELIASRLATPQLKKTLDLLKQRRENRDALSLQKLDALARMAESQKQLRETQERIAGLDESLEHERSELEQVRAALSQERERRTNTSTFPEERSTSLIPFNITIRYGRLYRDWNTDYSPNLDDFAVLDSDDEYLVVTPKPYRGLAISENGRLSKSVQNVLARKSPQGNYIEIGIWDDSFPEFQLIREYLVSRGYRYRIVVVSDGGVIAYGSVVDPKVQ